MNESMFLLAQAPDGSQASLMMIGGVVCCGALAVLAMIFFWGIGVYNGLIALRNQVKNAFSQIDVQLKRRYDLIPNLVETVKGYMGHEKGTLEAVISARAAAFNA
ncbi:MAG: LemA family protein, partial [Thermoguttaceae bacterium]|nr:LemA family protein [Thermoguttaceae bacterium]